MMYLLNALSFYGSKMILDRPNCFGSVAKSGQNISSTIGMTKKVAK